MPLRSFTSLRQSCLILLLLHPGFASAEVEIVVKGIEDELKKNVELFVGEPANENERNLQAFAENLPADVQLSLQALGYYNSQISIKRSTENEKSSTLHRIEISVDPGPPVKITQIDLELSGEAQTQNDKVFRKLIEKLPLKTGQVLNHKRYEEAKNALFDAAQERGFFDARFLENVVKVRKDLNTAEIVLRFDSGRRYRFGEILFDSDIFSDKFLNRWVPFTPGEAYEAIRIAEFTRQLQSSGYFSKVRVRTLRDQSREYHVPIKVDLEAANDNKIGFGVGFATDTGPRTKLTWRRPHHNSRGHSIDISAGISEIQQEFSAQYKIPKRKKPLTDYYLADFGALNEDTDDTRSQLRTLNFQHIHQTPRLWQQSIFIRWEHEKFETADESETTNLILPGISYSRTQLRGGTSPRWGNHLSFQLMGGTRQFFSDIDMFKSVLSMRWLRTYKVKHKLIMGLDYGAISTDEFDKVPATHRFFVGGDRSIRGFKYHSIAPEDDEGNLLGGRFMEVGTIEYDYRFYEKWSVAVFVDAGRAFDHFDERYRVGTGVGIRWQSPVGPLRIDMGVGVSEEDKPIQFHLSLGPDL